MVRYWGVRYWLVTQTPGYSSPWHTLSLRKDVAVLGRQNTPPKDRHRLQGCPVELYPVVCCVLVRTI